MRTAFVTGGAGLVGRELVAQLAAEGVAVRALARTWEAADAVRGAGAEPVHGDLLRAPGAWAAEAAGSDVVFHLAQPRLRPPVRRHGARARARESARAARALAAAVPPELPRVILSTGLVYGDRPDAPADEASRLAPLMLARAALAAEEALAGPETRVVRLPWVYGTGGLLPDLVRGLRARRYRIVGGGGNRWSLLSAADAAAALRAAAGAPPGAYNAAEGGEAPAQADVVRALCALPGVLQPDHLPPALAALPLGGATSQALAASLHVRGERLRAHGWRPTDTWREDLVSLAARLRGA
jgi:nucleoside-diphosphate-sugar epimerase